MALITYEDKEELNENIDIPDKNKTTADDMNMIKNAINSLWHQQYPVGRIVMFYDLDDHSNYLGFTWQRCLVGKFPIGYDSSDADFNSIGKTGGEKEHTLTEDELAEHQHPGLFYNNKDQTPISFIRGSGSTVQGYGISYTMNANIYSAANIQTYASGGGQPHNNLPPYEVISYWRRIA